MELIVEFLLELLLEVLFAAVVGLFDSGLSPSTRAPGLRAFALATAGVGLGFVSTFVFPHHFIQARTLQLVWLLVAPLLGGALIAGFRAVVPVSLTPGAGRSSRWARSSWDASTPLVSACWGRDLGVKIGAPVVTLEAVTTF